MKTLISSGLGLLLLLSASQPSRAADAYGIVIGIDAYKTVSPLSGAVNDAKMIAASLNAVGLKETKVLLDEKATRDEVKKAWHDIAAKAKSGDTVFFTYAGHGAQQAERLKGTEADGLDEFYVLADFAPSGKSTYERVVDDDLWEWFGSRPDLTIVLVSDSCHSGTMTRGYKNSKLKYRKVDVRAITDDALPLPANRALIDEVKTKQQHVIAFSGAQDHEEVPEVTIDNQPHGALSWYFAQGLQGAADDNQDGVISISEIKNYLLEKVRMKTDGQQHPQVQFFRDINLIQSTNAAPPHKQTADSAETVLNEETALPLAITQGSTAAGNSLKPIIGQLIGVQLVESDKAVLGWDVDSGVIRNKFDDVVFNFNPAASQTKAFQRNEAGTAFPPATVKTLQAIIDKFRLVEQLKQLSDGSLEIRLLPSDKLHAKDETVALEINRLKYPYLTLLNLAVDGTINFLYPSLSTDKLEVPTNTPYKLELGVSEPFGSDHFLVLVSDKPLTHLHEKLKSLNSTVNLTELKTSLATGLNDTKYQIGLHASFTVNTL